MNDIKFTASAAANIGKLRLNNEDNLYFNGEYLKAKENVHSKCMTINEKAGNAAYAVFDGMGGESSGELASETAACVFAKCMKKINRFGKPEKAFRGLQKFYNSAQKEVLKISKKKHSTVGTTAAVAVVIRDKLIVSNIGDSKVLQYRNGSLIQLSEDHNMAEIMVRNGAMSREEAEKCLGAGELVRFIGAPHEDYDYLPFYSGAIDLLPDDCYLICSDGLTNELSNNEIAEIIGNYSESCLEAVNVLIDSVLAHGGRDNVTIILIRVSSAD